MAWGVFIHFVVSPLGSSRAGERDDGEAQKRHTELLPVGGWPALVTHPDLTARGPGKWRKSWIVGEHQEFLPQAPTWPIIPVLWLPLGLFNPVFCEFTELSQQSPNNSQLHKVNQQIEQDMEGISGTDSVPITWGLRYNVEQTGSFLSVSRHHLHYVWIK